MPFSEIITCPYCDGLITGTSDLLGHEIACPHCAQPFVYLLPFDKYLLERKIGSGGMGDIYLATETGLDGKERKIALKVIHPHLADNPKFVETFLREGQTTASLNHPHIVHIFSSGQCEGFCFLTMEYLSGGSLEERMAAGKKLDESEAIDIALGIASALRLAAIHGLVHRDIKPGNILFTAKGTPKLVDFGLSLRSREEQANDAEVWGTPYYLPPERLQREPEDFRSDLYSLGATLFHALAGRPPYEEPDPKKIIECHKGGPPPSLRLVAPHVSTALARIIDRMLAQRPQDRFSSYDDLVAELDRIRHKLDRKSRKTFLKKKPETLQTKPKKGLPITLFALGGGAMALVLAGWFLLKRFLL